MIEFILAAAVMVHPGESIQKAILKVRGSENPVVRIEKGRYYLSEPIELTPKDSGLKLLGPEEGSAVIDGGLEFKSFKVGADGVWECEVPSSVEFNQLWVNGVRAQRARIPNEGFLYMADRAEKLPTRSFIADKKDIAPLLNLDKADLDRVLVAHWESWDMGYDQIESLDRETGLLVMKKGTMWKLFDSAIGRPRYAIENLKAALDAPGEWFHDLKAGKLFYIPRPGEQIDSSSAVAAWVKRLLVIKGDLVKKELVRDITIENLGFEHSAFGPGLGDLVPGQAAIDVAGDPAILVDGAEQITLKNLKIQHCGAYGMWLRRAVKGATIEHAFIEDTGSGAVAIGNIAKPDFKHPEFDTGDIRLVDSILRTGGRYNNSACGVWIGNAHHVTVEHNDISDYYYTGISVGWLWGYKPSINVGNRIAFNRIRDIAQARLSDVGGIYILGPNSGMQVTGNWISDVNGYLYFGSPAWGLYADEGTSEVTFSSNLVERCRKGAFHHHYGKNNRCENNIFATFKECGFWRGGPESHISQELKRNIFWWEQPDAKAFNTMAEGLPADNNIYWCFSPKRIDGIFNGETLAKWQQSGNDLHGIIADPMFYDAKNGDWRLKKNSPALKRGFKPFDWTDAGVLKRDKTWRQLAEKRVARPLKDVKPPDAPAKILENLSFDVEMIGTGVIRNTMDVMKPFKGVPGKPGTLYVTDKDAAQGARALVFKEVDGLQAPWMPHIFAPCMVTGGVAYIEFSFKGGEDSSMAIECRDSATIPGQQVTGLLFGVDKGRLAVEGKEVAKIPYGVWTRISLSITLSGENVGAWTCSARLPNGETPSLTGRGFRNGFARLTWVGFMSYGKNGSEFQIDDFKLHK